MPHGDICRKCEQDKYSQACQCDQPKEITVEDYVQKMAYHFACIEVCKKKIRESYTKQGLKL